MSVGKHPFSLLEKSLQLVTETLSIMESELQKNFLPEHIIWL